MDDDQQEASLEEDEICMFGLTFADQTEIFRDVSLGDPRLPPYPDAFEEKTKEAIGDPRRWLKNRSDSLAMRLQYGRGAGNHEICLQFAVNKSTLLAHARLGQWSREVSELNRRSLAQHVWLAGVARLGVWRAENPGAALPAERLDALRRASAWQKHAPLKPLWQPLDASAHQSSKTPEPSEVQLEQQSLLGNPANPDRTHRDRVAANLDRLIARLEQQQREKAAQAAAEAGIDGAAGAENPSNDGL
jgi:hypothetical protein